MNIQQEVALGWIGRQLWLRRHRRQEPTALPAQFQYLSGMDKPFLPAIPGVEWGPITEDEVETVNERIAIMLENPSMDEESATVCALWLVLRARGVVERWEA